MMNFFDCLHRGKAFGVTGNRASIASGQQIGIQLFNPTLKQDNESITAYVKSVTVWSETATFCAMVLFNTRLATTIINGKNLANEDFPTTTNAISQLVVTSEESAVVSAAGGAIKQVRLPDSGSHTFSNPEWITKLPRGDNTLAGINTGTGLLLSFNTIPAGKYVGAYFDWVEVNP